MGGPTSTLIMFLVMVGICFIAYFIWREKRRKMREHGQVYDAEMHSIDHGSRHRRSAIYFKFTYQGREMILPYYPGEALQKVSPGESPQKIIYYPEEHPDEVIPYGLEEAEW